MSLPDSLRFEFAGKYTQFNGITLAVVRKADTVLLQFDGIGQLDEKKSLQILGLLERMKKSPVFTVKESADVPDAHWNAPDITDADREKSIFLEPVPGKTPEEAQMAVLQILMKQRAVALLTAAQKAQIAGNLSQGFTLGSP